MSNSSPSIPSQAQACTGSDKRGSEVATLIQTPNDSSQTYGDVRYAQSRDGADFPRDRQASVNTIGYSLAFGELARISIV